MTELILLRHGETDWNRQLRFQGQIDVALNTIGHEQALRLAQRLTGQTVHQLYTSDLRRAQQTATPVARALQLLPISDAALREQNFGCLEGMQVDEIKQRHPQLWQNWLQFHEDFCLPEGESTRQFHTRVMDAVQRLAMAHRGATLVVITHGGVLDMIYRSARSLGLSGPRQSEIPNAGLSRVRVREGGIDILSWADIAHLAQLPAQPVYDQQKLVVPNASAHGALPQTAVGPFT